MEAEENNTSVTQSVDVTQSGVVKNKNNAGESLMSIQVKNLTLGAAEFLETHAWVVVFLEQMKSELKLQNKRMNLLWEDEEEDGFDEEYRRIRNGRTLCFVVPRVTKISMNDTRNLMLCEHFWFFYQERFAGVKIPNHFWVKMIYECISQIAEGTRERMIKELVKKLLEKERVSQKTADILTDFENYPYDTFY